MRFERPVVSKPIIITYSDTIRTELHRVFNWQNTLKCICFHIKFRKFSGAMPQEPILDMGYLAYRGHPTIPTLNSVASPPKFADFCLFDVMRDIGQIFKNNYKN